MCSDTSWGSLGEPMLKSSQEFFQTRPAPPDRLEGQGHWKKESDMEEWRLGTYDAIWWTDGMNIYERHHAWQVKSLLSQ